ncbi:hypothetical protein BHM03_00004847 [Ensete ventricosum]|nr:hypothetical protein BHM03_00004847 [Ensete ventricosum]
MVTGHPYLRSLLRLLLTMPSYFVAASVVLALSIPISWQCVCVHPRVGQNTVCLRRPPETAWATTDLLRFLWPSIRVIAKKE